MTARAATSQRQTSISRMRATTIPRLGRDVGVQKSVLPIRAGAVKNMIKRRFAEIGSPATIPLQRRGTFTATLVDRGVNVDNLGNLPLLPWATFDEAVRVIIRNGGRALRGNAMMSRLGDSGLPLDSVEGHVAYAVYGKRPGDMVFRRISPIAAILLWAGICRARPRELVLAPVNLPASKLRSRTTR